MELVAVVSVPMESTVAGIMLVADGPVSVAVGFVWFSVAVVDWFRPYTGAGRPQRLGTPRDAVATECDKIFSEIRRVNSATG